METIRSKFGLRTNRPLPSTAFIQAAPAARRIAAAVLALACVVAACLGQQSEFVPPALKRLPVPAGSAEVSLRLETAQPLKVGDEIVLQCDRTELPIRIVLPDGTRFDRTNAGDHGFYWDSVPFDPPFGKSDGGERIRIEARQPHPSGTYTVVVSGPRPAAEVDGALFIYPPAPTPELLHQMLIASIPGARCLSPVTVPPRTADFILPVEVASDTELAVGFEVVVPNRAVKVRLETPDGTVWDETMPSSDEQRWQVDDGPATGGDDDGWNPIDLTKLLFPQPGIHHGITLPSASKGTYRIHFDTRSSAAPVVVHAMYLPVMQMLTDMFGHMEKDLEPPQDRVGLFLQATDGEALVGDKIPLKVTMSGPPVDDPIRFEIGVETRPVTKPGGPGPREFGEPVLEQVLLELRRTEPQLYEATYAAAKPGALRFEVRARGTMANGEPFDLRSVANGPVVSPLSSKFIAIRERAVDIDANGYPDRLELSAELDVVIAGEYDLEVHLQESNAERPAWRNLHAEGKARLQPGRQTLTATIPAAEILKWATSDGPYRASWISIKRLNGSYVAGLVDTAGAALVTKAYRRDDWAAATLPVALRFEWRPADRLGREDAQVLEVDWLIASPGGLCKWGGKFVRLTGEGDFDLPAMEANLPAGRVVLPFDVLANRLLPFGSSTWRFQPSLKCEASESAVVIPLDQAPRVPFHAASFEPLPRGVLFRRMPPIAAVAGKPVPVDLRFGVGAEPPASGSLAIVTASETLDCVLGSPARFAPRPEETVSRLLVTPKPATPPGEYEIVLALDADGVRTRMPLRVIVAAPEP